MPAPNRYDIGDVTRISTVTQSDLGVDTDPNELTLTVQVDADDTPTVYRWPTPGVGESAMVKDSTGHFHADYANAAAGVVKYRWVATGAVASAEQSYYFVRPSVIA